jgi:hypothetical protein
MSLYSIMLFIHVSGAICLFIGMSIWLFGIIAISHTSRVEQVRELAELMVMVRLVVPASALVVVVAGLTMARIAWGLYTGWIAVAIGGLFLIGPIGTWVIDPRVRAIAAEAHTLPDGPLPTTFAERIHDPVLGTALRTLIALLFGIVFLMTTKPALPSAIGAMVVAALLGLASGLPFVRARRESRSNHLL